MEGTPVAFKGQVTDTETDDGTADPSIEEIKGTLGELLGDVTEVSLLDRLRAMPDDADDTVYEHPNPWMPLEKGDGLEGVVENIGVYYLDDFGQDKMLRTWLVKDKDGVIRSVIPFHRKLRTLMSAHRAEKGDRVALLYMGLKESESDSEIQMHDYRVARVSAGRTRVAQRRATVSTNSQYGK